IQAMVRTTAVDDLGGGARRADGRRQSDRHARPGGERVPEPGRVPGGRRERASRLHRRLYEGMGAIGEAFHDDRPEFEDEGAKARYTARVLHWTIADREAHEKMGFHQGWSQCADQLTALVSKD